MGTAHAFPTLPADFDKIKTLLKNPVIFDGRNQYNAERLKEKGFEYYQIGVGK